VKIEVVRYVARRTLPYGRLFINSRGLLCFSMTVKGSPRACDFSLMLGAMRHAVGTEACEVGVRAGLFSAQSVGEGRLFRADLARYASDLRAVRELAQQQEDYQSIHQLSGPVLVRLEGCVLSEEEHIGMGGFCQVSLVRAGAEQYICKRPRDDKYEEGRAKLLQEVYVLERMHKSNWFCRYYMREDFAACPVLLLDVCSCSLDRFLHFKSRVFGLLFRVDLCMQATAAINSLHLQRWFTSTLKPKTSWSSSAGASPTSS
jgi:hypothetical protein